MNYIIGWIEYFRSDNLKVVEEPNKYAPNCF